jgi:hypothetical protein
MESKNFIGKANNRVHRIKNVFIDDNLVLENELNKMKEFLIT